MLLSRVVLVLTFLCVAAPSEMRAQAARRWGLDASIGPSRGGGGNYNERSNIAVDALVAVRLRRSAGYSPIGALSAGYLAIPSGDDTSCEPHPDGGCFERFPRLSYHSWLVGAEFLHERGASLRILSGFVWVRGGFDYTEAKGVQARVEVGPFHIASTAPILGLRMTYVTDYLGESLTVWSGGLGLRIR